MISIYNNLIQGNNYLKYTMIKLKYTTYVKILVIIVIKINKLIKLIKRFPKEVRFQRALKNP